MSQDKKNQIKSDFPRLTNDTFEITSPPSWDYNCIAWSADNSSKWWWPDVMHNAYWPPNVPREETLDAFIQAYEKIGYTITDNSDYEDGLEKIGIYTDENGEPTHAARQLSSDSWTSKLGPDEDIEHNTLEGLHGDIYGEVAVLMSKPTSKK